MSSSGFSCRPAPKSTGYSEGKIVGCSPKLLLKQYDYWTNENDQEEEEENLSYEVVDGNPTKVLVFKEVESADEEDSSVSHKVKRHHKMMKLSEDCSDIQESFDNFCEVHKRMRENRPLSSNLEKISKPFMQPLVERGLKNATRPMTAGKLADIAATKYPDSIFRVYIPEGNRVMKKKRVIPINESKPMTPPRTSRLNVFNSRSGPYNNDKKSELPQIESMPKTRAIQHMKKKHSLLSQSSVSKKSSNKSLPISSGTTLEPQHVPKRITLLTDIPISKEEEEKRMKERAMMRRRTLDVVKRAYPPQCDELAQAAREEADELENEGEDRLKKGSKSSLKSVLSQPSNGCVPNRKCSQKSVTFEKEVVIATLDDEDGEATGSQPCFMKTKKRPLHETSRKRRSRSVEFETERGRALVSRKSSESKISILKQKKKGMSFQERAINTSDDENEYQCKEGADNARSFKKRQNNRRKNISNNKNHSKKKKRSETDRNKNLHSDNEDDRTNVNFHSKRNAIIRKHNPSGKYNNDVQKSLPEETKTFPVLKDKSTSSLKICKISRESIYLTSSTSECTLGNNIRKPNKIKSDESEIRTVQEKSQTYNKSGNRMSKSSEGSMTSQEKIVLKNEDFIKPVEGKPTHGNDKKFEKSQLILKGEQPPEDRVTNHEVNRSSTSLQPISSKSLGSLGVVSSCSNLKNDLRKPHSTCRLSAEQPVSGLDKQFLLIQSFNALTDIGSGEANSTKSEEANTSELERESPMLNLYNEGRPTASADNVVSKANENENVKVSATPIALPCGNNNGSQVGQSIDPEKNGPPKRMKSIKALKDELNSTQIETKPPNLKTKIDERPETSQVKKSTVRPQSSQQRKVSPGKINEKTPMKGQSFSDRIADSANAKISPSKASTSSSAVPKKNSSIITRNATKSQSNALSTEKIKSDIRQKTSEIIENKSTQLISKAIEDRKAHLQKLLTKGEEARSSKVTNQILEKWNSTKKSIDARKEEMLANIRRSRGELRISKELDSKSEKSLLTKDDPKGLKKKNETQIAQEKNVEVQNENVVSKNEVLSNQSIKNTAYNPSVMTTSEDSDEGKENHLVKKQESNIMIDLITTLGARVPQPYSSTDVLPISNDSRNSELDNALSPFLQDDTPEKPLCESSFKNKDEVLMNIQNVGMINDQSMDADNDGINDQNIPEKDFSLIQSESTSSNGPGSNTLENSPEDSFRSSSIKMENVSPQNNNTQRESVNPTHSLNNEAILPEESVVEKMPGSGSSSQFNRSKLSGSNVNDKRSKNASSQSPVFPRSNFGTGSRERPSSGIRDASSSGRQRTDIRYIKRPPSRKPIVIDSSDDDDDSEHDMPSQPFAINIQEDQLRFLSHGRESPKKPPPSRMYSTLKDTPCSAQESLKSAIRDMHGLKEDIHNVPERQMSKERPLSRNLRSAVEERNSKTPSRIPSNSFNIPRMPSGSHKSTKNKSQLVPKHDAAASPRSHSLQRNEKEPKSWTRSQKRQEYSEDRLSTTDEFYRPSCSKQTSNQMNANTKPTIKNSKTGDEWLSSKLKNFPSSSRKIPNYLPPWERVNLTPPENALKERALHEERHKNFLRLNNYHHDNINKNDLSNGRTSRTPGNHTPGWSTPRSCTTPDNNYSSSSRYSSPVGARIRRGTPVPSELRTPPTSRPSSSRAVKGRSYDKQQVPLQAMPGQYHHVPKFRSQKLGKLRYSENEEWCTAPSKEPSCSSKTEFLDLSVESGLSKGSHSFSDVLDEESDRPEIYYSGLEEVMSTSSLASSDNMNESEMSELCSTASDYSMTAHPSQYCLKRKKKKKKRKKLVNLKIINSRTSVASGLSLSFCL